MHFGWRWSCSGSRNNGLHAREGDVFTPRILQLIEEVTEKSWQTPHAQRVDSLTNYQHIRAKDDDIIISSLAEDSANLSSEDLNIIRGIAVNEPLLRNRLVAPDGKTTGIFITLNFPGDDHRLHVPETVSYIRDLVAQIRSDYPDIQVSLSGTAIISYALDEVAVEDLSQLAPALFIILLVLIWAILRSVRYSLMIGLVTILSAVSAMGLAAAIGITLTTASVSAPVIILTLAVADAIHFVSSVRGSSQTGRPAIAEALQINFKPITLTSITTLIGFLSLNFSASPPFRDLGNIAAMGVVLAWGISVTLVPALAGVIGSTQGKAAPLRLMDWEKFADIIIVRRTPILVLSGLLTILCLGLIPLNRLDDQVVDWFGEETQIRQDIEFLVENLTGPYRMDFSLATANGDSIAQPEYLHDVDAFAGWLKSQPGVLHVDAFTDVMRRLNRAMNNGDEAFYSLPDNTQSSAQYILLYEMSLPYGLDPTAQVSFDKTATRVSATLDKITSAETRALTVRAKEWAEQNLKHANASAGTGTAVMFTFVSERTINGMLYGTGLAFLLISLALLLALRNLRLGLLSLLPNILPVMMTFGIWAVTVGEIGIVASSIAATTLGLVVDDTVHFLSKYHYARYHHRLAVHDGIRQAFKLTGPAMLTTTIVLGAGFSVLMLSDFLINWQMGILTAITVTMALLLDFTLLPTLLMVFDRDQFCNCKTCACSHQEGSIQAGK